MYENKWNNVQTAQGSTIFTKNNEESLQRKEDKQ